MPLFKTLADLNTELGVRVDDASHARWATAVKDAAIADAIRIIGHSYRIPAMYADLEFSAGTTSYALPDYVQRVDRIEVEAKQWPYEYNSDTTDDVYLNVAYFDIVQDADGGRTLLLDAHVPTASTRIWYTVPLPVPPTGTQAVVKTGDMTAAQTTVPFATAADALKWPWPGWCKIEDEFIYYAEIDPADGLKTATRGVSSTAATHAATETVNPVIPAVEADLYGWLLDAAEAWLNQQRLYGAAVGERSHHVWLARWARQWQEERQPNAGMRTVQMMVSREGAF